MIRISDNFKTSVFDILAISKSCIFCFWSFVKQTESLFIFYRISSRASYSIFEPRNESELELIGNSWTEVIIEVAKSLSIRK